VIIATAMVAMIRDAYVRKQMIHGARSLAHDREFRLERKQQIVRVNVSKQTLD